MNFKHSGATGDIIYSLPVIKSMVGGNLYIVPYDKQRALSIANLISKQPYIGFVQVTNAIPDNAVNLDLFRQYAGHHNNLIEAHFKGQNLEANDYKQPWLTLPALGEYPVIAGYSVINVTENYADPNFNWSAEVEYLLTISDTCYFIGYESEYNIFQEKYNTKAIFYECDFLYGAYLIQYANMFTGCYSAMSTIAQGLGINFRLVQAPGHTCSSLFCEREKIINA